MSSLTRRTLPVQVWMCFLFPVSVFGQSEADDVPPNVLFIAVDDLNTWVGCLGGHPQAKTPNIDRLAEQGVLFERAYCSAPLCNPSRTSLLLGLNPSTTGIYGNLNWFRDHPKFGDWVTLPQYFRNHGYQAYGGGKIFHLSGGKWSDPLSWDEQYTTQSGTPAPPVSERYRHGMRDQFEYNPIVARLNDWGPIRQTIEQTQDWKTADGAATLLKKNHDKPFFIACGIYRPHLSWYAPRKFFDMHPIDEIVLPPHRADDLEDIPEMGHRMSGKTFQIIQKHGQWKSAVQGYLASCTFADACIGHVLDALDESRYRDNTIVVLWGDHGYAIGEKNHFSKSALWVEETRTPLIISAPGLARGRCQSPVSLVDLYPTLVELCGLPPRDGLDGRSIAPLVRDPKTEWTYPALTSHSPHWYGPNHAIHSKRYHYIYYRDGTEELYDLESDPRCWTNLASDPNKAAVKNELKGWLPKFNAPHYGAP